MLAAPNGMKKGDILDLLQDMVGGYNSNPNSGNVDGFGFAYVSEKGEFCIKKTQLSFPQVLKKKSYKKFIDWPDTGWKIIHLRKGSIGGNGSYRNAHPFFINYEDNEYVSCHNGTHREYELIKAALPNKKYNSDTDSEIILTLLAKIGPKKFNKISNDNGVYLTINKNGELTAIKNTFQGDLKIAALDEKRDFLISELSHDSGYKNEELDSGFYIFNKEGEMIKSHRKVDETSNYVSNKGYKKTWRNDNSSCNISTIPNQAALPGIYQHNSQVNKKPVRLSGGNPMVGNFSEEMYHGGPWD